MYAGYWMKPSRSPAARMKRVVNVVGKYEIDVTS